jgi:hypothetical protein
MTLQEFTEVIIEELTSGDSMPLYINEREIHRIIDKAKKWFHVNYGKAVEKKFFVINDYDLVGAQFSQNRTIVLPDCVISVTKCRELGGGLFRFHPGLKEIGMDRLVASELMINQGAGDALVFMTARMQFLDLSKAFFLQDISVDFNFNTKKLVFIGRDPKKSVVLETFSKIEDYALFDDYYFLSWCTAQAKLSTARVMGQFDFNLPGGIKMNKEMFQQEGQEEMTALKQEILDLQPPDYFAMFN